MTVTNLEPFGSRVKVYIDDSFAFVLYKGEISKNNIAKGYDISEDTYNKIYEVLYNRGKERALYMLDNSYKTEKYIREKLEKGLYPSDIIDEVIKFLKDLDLVNDKRYAEMYIDYRKETRSKKQIIQELYQKGVSRELIGLAFEESDFSDQVALCKYIEKRLRRYDLTDKKDVQKFYSYLVSKGFSYGDIKEVMRDYLPED
ncbi:MAG: regulatory protein RecX [Eubacterium sp.]|nr:regulatory protein RecX [Eubacterium sp.]